MDRGKQKMIDEGEDARGQRSCEGTGYDTSRDIKQRDEHPGSQTRETETPRRHGSILEWDTVAIPACAQRPLESNDESGQGA
jgi:hypothetical protein